MHHLIKATCVAAALGMLGSASAMADGPARSYGGPAYYHDEGGNWSGIHIGAAIGLSYSASDLTHNWTDVGPVAVADTYDSNSNGMTATFSVGFDRLLNNHLLWGLFGDYTIGATRDRVTLATPGFVDVRFRTEDSWAAGGRAGIIHDGALWYVAGGYTGIQVKFGPEDGTLHGYFVGGGIEKDLHPNVRMKLEYRYADYDSDTLFSGAESLDVETSIHSVRLGLVFVMGHQDRSYHEPLK